MKRLLKKNDGYFTVEAVLIFSTTLFVIYGISVAFMIMYQSVVLTNAATAAAQEVAYSIGASREETPDIEVLIDQKLSKGMFSNSLVEKDIERSTVLFQPVITVSLKQRIPIPLADIIQVFNEDALIIKVSSTARATDRPAFARSINLIREIAKRIASFTEDFRGDVIKLPF